MARESRGFVLLTSLGGILLAAGIASLFILGTRSSHQPAGLWVAGWALTVAGVLTFVGLAAWPALLTVGHSLRIRFQYRASNTVDEAGRRWLQLDRPTDTLAHFCLTIVDPGNGTGRMFFSRPGRRIRVEFPGRDFDVGVAPPPGKYRVLWEVGKSEVIGSPSEPVVVNTRLVATAKDSFTLPR